MHKLISLVLAVGLLTSMAVVTTGSPAIAKSLTKSVQQAEHKATKSLGVKKPTSKKSVISIKKNP